MKYSYLTSFNPRTGQHFRRPIVDVEIFGPTGNFSTIALLDSGADNCLFNIEYAKEIGIDLNKCTKTSTTGVEGDRTDVYLTEIYIQVTESTALDGATVFDKREIIFGAVYYKSFVYHLGAGHFGTKRDYEPAPTLSAAIEVASTPEMINSPENAKKKLEEDIRKKGRVLAIREKREIEKQISELEGKIKKVNEEISSADKEEALLLKEAGGR